MDIAELVQRVLDGDALGARQWVADAERACLRWDEIPEPEGLNPTEMAVAAGLVELLAERHHQPSAPWTTAVAAAPAPLFLVRAAATLPRLRELCLRESPAPLRRRQIFAPSEFLSVA